MSQERKREQKIEENSHKHAGAVRVQREELPSGRNENNMFISEGGVAALHWQRGARWTRLNNGVIHAEEPL